MAKRLNKYLAAFIFFSLFVFFLGDCVSADFRPLTAYNLTMVSPGPNVTIERQQEVILCRSNVIIIVLLLRKCPKSPSAQLDLDTWLLPTFESIFVSLVFLSVCVSMNVLWRE